LKKINHILSAHQLIETEITKQQGKNLGIAPLIDSIFRHHISISRASSLIGHQIRPPLAKNQNISSSPQTFFSVPIKINEQMHVTVNKPLYSNDKFGGFI
jgi:hypothetical protein